MREFVLLRRRITQKKEPLSSCIHPGGYARLVTSVTAAGSGQADDEKARYAQHFPFFVVFFLLIAAVLYFFPPVKLLNFVDYGTAEERMAQNRFAALRFLLPALVSVGCSLGAAHDVRLTLPLVFVIALSILATVIWISAGWRAHARPS